MLTFVQPVALLLLLLLLPLWLLSWLAQRAAVEQRPVRSQQGRFLRWLRVLLPSAAVVALVGALAGTHAVIPDRSLTVVFLLDRSDSVAPGERERAESFLRAAMAALPVGDQAGVVVFGERAVPLRLPSEERTLDPITVTTGGGHTDIAGAVQLGLAMLPSEGRRRLVLLSDGNENSGDVERVAQVAAARNVPLDVVPLDSGTSGVDAQITSIELPQRARQGQQVRLTIGTSSPEALPARLTILANGVAVSQSDVQLAAGRGTLAVDLSPSTSGFIRYTAQLDVAGDARTQNNRAETFAVVSGPPRVLLLAPGSEDSAPLQAALQTANVDVELQLPAALPTSLGQLSRYDAIVLANVPFSALPRSADTLLPAYVRDLGRGLAMLGGAQSLGAGGYRQTGIEKALPVTMDPRPDLQAPPVAMTVLIDVSGSMAEFAGDSTKLQLAANGTIRIAEQLRDEDTLTIIPFDRMEMGTIGPLPGSARETVPERLKALGPGSGGIYISDGLQTAQRYINRATQQVRHLIILTDGSDTVQKETAEATVQQLNAAGVTVTLVALGSGKDVPFIRDLARQGGGRFFLVEDATGLPKIMADEARLVLRPYIIEKPFVPERTEAAPNSPLLRGIENMPPLNGYIASQPKEQGTVLLRTADDEPLLATWQYGLGHSLVWTSDMSGRWSGDFIRSPQFPRLTAQLVSWLLPPAASERLSLQAQAEGNAVQLTVTTADDEGHPIGGLRVAGQLLAPDGTGRAVTLREVAPGIYGAVAQNLPPGSYAVDLVATDANGSPVATATGGAVLASSEYREVETNQHLLQEIATRSGGIVDPQPDALFDAPAVAEGRSVDLTRPLLVTALLLLPLIVLVRRLRFRRGALAAAPVPLNELSAPDRAWLALFGSAPFYAAAQRRKHRRAEQQAWATWIHEQAQQVTDKRQETGDGRQRDKEWGEKVTR